MKGFTIVLAIALLGGCSDPSGNVRAGSEGSYSLKIPDEFDIAEPIPDGDQWLKTFRAGNGYKEGVWETWVWRLTDIRIADGLKVYARDRNEKQFLVTGCDEFKLLSVDFRRSEVGHSGFYSGEHNVKLSPSGNYIVCLAENPKSYLHGLPIDDPVKRSGDWAVTFEDETAKWHRTEPGDGDQTPTAVDQQSHENTNTKL